jgi:hypothetical protein
MAPLGLLSPAGFSGVFCEIATPGTAKYRSIQVDPAARAHGPHADVCQGEPACGLAG